MAAQVQAHRHDPLAVKKKKSDGTVTSFPAARGRRTSYGEFGIIAMGEKTTTLYVMMSGI
jgi:hypothetical protein